MSLNKPFARHVLRGALLLTDLPLGKAAYYCSQPHLLAGLIDQYPALHRWAALRGEPIVLHPSLAAKDAHHQRLLRAWRQPCTE